RSARGEKVLACTGTQRAHAALTRTLRPCAGKHFFATSGTEAVECALKTARMYTGRNKIVARYSSYHGSTAGSIAATSDYRRWFAEPLSKAGGVLHAPPAHCYQCPLKKDPKTCKLACLDYMEYMMENENPQDIAAVIVEPVVGTNGILVPPADYLPRLREYTRKHGILLIADEVMCGWGRVGEWFAVNAWNVTPDILVTAKGITSAMAPLGLVTTSRAIAAHFDDHIFSHGHTYEAHPLTLAPAVAAIDEYKRLNLIERSKSMGAKLGAALRKLADKHPSVGDVRGMGLFWAVELVKNRDTREPMNTAQDKVNRRPTVIDAVTADMMSRGVFCVGWISHLVIAPPLIIEDEHIEEAVAALDAALCIADRAVVAA
ncbi:aspartate aminotransferase family protein, partial [archaeon]